MVLITAIVFFYAVDTPPGCFNGCFLGREMATSTALGYYHFIYFRVDPSRPWTYRQADNFSVNLAAVATHEIGHILCLPHNDAQIEVEVDGVPHTYSSSIMSSISNPYIEPKVDIIDEDSRSQMKNLYGM